MTEKFDTLSAVRITREHIAECNQHTPTGSKLGCPMCFLRAEHAVLEFARRHPDELEDVLITGSMLIKAQVLRQESES